MMEEKDFDSLNSLLGDYEKQKAINSATAWKRLHKRIAFDRNKRLFIRLLRNTAAVLFVLFSLYHYLLLPTLSEKMTEEIISVTSAPGMVTKIILPDGSKVWLNAQSTLAYPREFTRRERSVRLSGEAYFKVVSDKKHRFNVEMPQNMSVSAYGTEFNVEAYENEKSYEVTLAKGHLEVSSGIGTKSAKVLNADEKATLNPFTGNIDIATADTYVETAWKEGKMVFRREKLDKIVEKLARKFGVEIRLEGERLREYEYTATFTNETLENILDLLQRSAPITYNISNQKQLDDETFTHKEVIIKSR